MENIVVCVILGVLAGVLAGMGMGGGTVLIPMLTLICAFSQHTAQSINIVAFIPMSIIVLIIYFKNRLICYKTGVFIVSFALLGCVCGTYALSMISIIYLKLIYSIFLSAIGIWLLILVVIQFVKKSTKISKNEKNIK